MSYVALATDRFDEVARFYGEGLGFSVVAEWDRPNGRGRRFDLGGLRLEILDNARERRPLTLSEPADRFHVVVEVEDVEAARGRIAIEAPPPQGATWGGRLFQVRDPDGVPVTFLQWDRPEDGTS
jgi:catechol 2,3-dioxygenase-like lactoylglutathione lyase family enzyme